jgi:hypothetical protein
MVKATSGCSAQFTVAPLGRPVVLPARLLAKDPMLPGRQTSQAGDLLVDVASELMLG